MCFNYPLFTSTSPQFPQLRGNLVMNYWKIIYPLLLSTSMTRDWLAGKGSILLISLVWNFMAVN